MSQTACLWTDMPLSLCMSLLQSPWPSVWLKEQKFIVSQFWKLQVQDQGISLADSSWGLWVRSHSMLVPHLLAIFGAICLLCASLLSLHNLYMVLCLRASLSSESASHSVLSDSLWPHGLSSPWNSPAQNTGVGSSSLLQGIFSTQGSNPDAPHCRQILYQLSHKGSPRILEWAA